MIVFDTATTASGLPSGMPTAGGAAARRCSACSAGSTSRASSRCREPRADQVVLSAAHLPRPLGRRPAVGRGARATIRGSDQGRKARRADGVSSILVTSNDLAAAWALDERGRPLYPDRARRRAAARDAFRTGVNIVMYALTGNYKADQVHVPALLERLGQ